ncbi:unnamed protein product [Lactuca virosa]|uniref:Uncharacterized protein n=1 Tax=Lactuca virosa TaxID=75947 RepID=A0AAU9NNG6_9ASTR|nr:unnamed protein product [Lactuca virosa]
MEIEIQIRVPTLRAQGAMKGRMQILCQIVCRMMMIPDVDDLDFFGERRKRKRWQLNPTTTNFVSHPLTYRINNTGHHYYSTFSTKLQLLSRTTTTAAIQHQLKSTAPAPNRLSTNIQCSNM